MQAGTRYAFPADFVWGAATASYQIEGATTEDGRGESIWDRFSKTPGAVRNGETGDIACDHYHRYPEDVELMRHLGLSAYRFSIAWPRIIPAGIGQVNTRGLDFYDRLVDELLSHGIQPFATLYHWDLPQALEDEGGWTNRATAEAFATYVETVVGRLGDRVKHWITHNEPWVAAWVGYGWGKHAPGREEGPAGALSASHHLLLSHGLAVPVIRRECPDARVGITLNLTPVYPATDEPADVKAASNVDGTSNRLFLDPIFRGTYPADIVELYREQQPRIEQGDLETISAPIDFLGINNYFRQIVRADPEKQVVFVRNPEGEYTAMDWEVAPDAFHDLLVRVSRDYAPHRMYVTENGAAYPDVRTHEGKVLDPERQHYLELYFAAAGRAIDDGVPLAGYFVWSLLDNFEWAEGYWKRFGIVYVDYPTLERVPKGSFQWYRSLIAEQRAASVTR
ncbi:MAG TPA: GH1 family beta-glucosidase [Chloroflexota bacterium]